ncbi:C4-dicarboxylate ABC transporter [Rhodovibrio sodomensis]|uniref:C4-dicarboxylate ABC transporter n=1 Tax=Rhodovibrio sodomensis TaxID=1088 RepID=A0ABS1DCE0_9PROT|nr:TRAP transporter substrate-binding protein [Rhodovibrio sodomensis]MBK1668050.1 C4-dicarboxylate ABC transporter [Rhodovibrio sodomensis]
MTGALALSALPGPAQAQGEVRWKLQTAFPTNLPGLGSPAQYLSEQLDAASGGRVQIRVFAPGKLVPTLEIAEAVSKAKIQAGFSATAYEQGQVPAASLFNSPPFGLKPWAFMAWYYEGGGHKMLQELFQDEGYNIHFELCGITGPETAGWYKQPITDVSDYDGMKIRFAGLGSEVIKEYGASVTLMGGSETFQALQTGRLDATEFSMPMIDQLIGFNKVAKYNLFPGWHAPANAVYLFVNGDSWAETSDANKALIKNVCRAATATSLAQNEYSNGKVLETYADKGVEVQQIPRETLKKLQQTTEKVLQREAEKDADFKRIWQSQKEFQRSHRLWEKRAHLPADFYDSE